MPFTRRSEWLVPVLLIVLSLVPAAAGTARLIELARGSTATAANARFFAAHILAVIPYCIFGAFQFAPAFRRRRRDWHRAAGRVLAVLGLATALT